MLNIFWILIYYKRQPSLNSCAVQWSYLCRPCLDNYDSKAMKWFIISTDKYISHMSSLVATYLIRTSQCFSSSDDVILSTNGGWRLNIKHILRGSPWVFFGNYGEKRTSVGGRDTQRLILGFGGNVLCGSYCRMSYWVLHFSRAPYYWDLFSKSGDLATLKFIIVRNSKVDYDEAV